MIVSTGSIWTTLALGYTAVMGAVIVVLGTILVLDAGERAALRSSVVVCDCCRRRRSDLVLVIAEGEPFGVCEDCTP